MYWMWTPVTCHKQSDVNGTKGLLTCEFWRRMTPATRRHVAELKKNRENILLNAVSCAAQMHAQTVYILSNRKMFTFWMMGFKVQFNILPRDVSQVFFS